MKKVSLILGSLALVLGLAQCNKPTQPVINLGEGVDTHIVFTTGGDNGAKGEFEENALHQLDYKWATTDFIEVYEGNGVTFTNHVGTLLNPVISGDLKSATFEGELEIAPASTHLRFVHYKGIAAGGSYSFASQDGSFDNVYNMLVGVCEQPINEQSEYLGDLQLPFAIVKLNVSAFGTEAAGGNDVTVKNANNTIMNISPNGDVTFSGGTTITLTGVDNETTETYMIVAPGETTLKFSGNGNEGSKEANIAANKYYTNEGESIEISANPMYLEGLFSVSDTKKVNFSRGNLFYVNGEWSYRNNQYDFYTCPGYQCVEDGVFKENGTPSKTYGSFAWSTQGNNYGVIPGQGGVLGSKTFEDWSDAINDGEAYTMTAEEWDYLFKTRTDADKLYKYAQFNGGNWAALIILPDGTDYTAAFAAFDGSTADNVSDLDDVINNYNAVVLPGVGSRTSNNAATDIGGWYIHTTGGQDSRPSACQWIWTSTTGEFQEGKMPVYYHIQYCPQNGQTIPAEWTLRSAGCSYGNCYGVRLAKVATPPSK